MCQTTVPDVPNSLVKWSSDSRSKFCALWASPAIRSQVQTAYLAGFSGYLDLRYLHDSGITGGTCRSTIYRRVLRTIPKDHVRIIDLGEKVCRHGAEGDVPGSFKSSKGQGYVCQEILHIS